MTASNQPSEFDRFQALARRILTTPKSELVKHPTKSKTMKKKARKK